MKLTYAIITTYTAYDMIVQPNYITVHEYSKVRRDFDFLINTLLVYDSTSLYKPIVADIN